MNAIWPDSSPAKAERLGAGVVNGMTAVAGYPLVDREALGDRYLSAFVFVGLGVHMVLLVRLGLVVWVGCWRGKMAADGF